MPEPLHPTGEAMLTIRDLHAWYGESHVLQGINLDVKAGECITPVSYTHLTLPTNREV